MQNSPAATQPGLANDSALTRTGRTVSALILREMSSTYGRSPGGYLWALLEPLGGIILMAFAFSLLLRAPSLGTSFILFFCTGFMPFSLYQTMESKVNGALGYSKSLLAYPRVTWIDAILARVILNFLTGLMVFFIVVTGILIVIENRSIINLTPIALGLLMMALLAVGIGMVNGVLKGLFPVWKQVWGIVSRPLFLASGIIFIYEDMPRAAQNVLWWNPMLHGTGYVRTGFYSTYEASYVSLAYGFGFGLATTALGLLLTRAHYKKALEK